MHEMMGASREEILKLKLRGRNLKKGEGARNKAAIKLNEASQKAAAKGKD